MKAFSAIVASFLLGASGSTAQSEPTLTTPQYDASATYRAVHIDTLDANFWPRFVETRRLWVQLQRARGTNDGRGAYYEVDHHTLISMRSFASFDEYHSLQAFRARVAERMGPTGRADEAAYDAGDVALRTPHASEVWQRDPSFDFHGVSPSLTEYSFGYAHVTYESVISADFDAAWSEIDQALKAANYPLTRIAFYSVLGTGKEISFWLASTREEFDAAGTPYEAVVRVIGEQKAIALFFRVKKSSIDQTVQEWVARKNLWSPF